MDQYGAIKADLYGPLGRARRGIVIGTYKDVELHRQYHKLRWAAAPAPAIWDVEYLKYLLRPEEDVWQFEKWGTVRLNAEKQLVLGTSVKPIHFVNAGGEGKWNIGWQSYYTNGIEPSLWDEINALGLYRPSPLG
jgi:hypothetical protein